jgi:YYY domain-containing protein
VASRRASGTVTRLPAFWPVTSRYYAALDDGSLGFEKVAEFNSHPSVLGITFNDTGAEESWSVYDHPQVTIYKKTEAYSPAKAVAALHADQYVVIPSTKPGDEAQNGLLFTPSVLAKQEAGGTWSSLFHPGNVINAHPLFFFLVAIELAAFSLVPLAVVGFRGLPDRGFLLTKPLGVFALAYLVYEPGSYGAVDFTRNTIAAMLGVMIAIGVITGLIWRREVVPWVRERWRFLLFAEAVFLLAFLFSYWIRLQNPDLYHPVNGGEKPMDFAYFNGVIRTTDLTQGPIDPWYAGGYLNYYWYGQFISATVTKLTGIVPEVAYNLVVPMFFSFLAAATFSVTYNLAEATRRLMRRRPGGVPIGRLGPILAGLGAIFLVCISGNLKAVQILEQSLAVQSHWHTLFGLDLPLVAGMVEIVGGFKEILFGSGSLHALWTNTPSRYDWWAPSRALSVQNPTTEVQPITEFPFWTFLFADLHAHLMAMPFAMTAVGVGLGAVMNFTRINPSGATKKAAALSQHISSWAMVVVLAVIVGALRWINSWDYPPFLLISAAALIIGERARTGRFTPAGLATGVLKAAVMGGLSYFLFARFAHNYSQSYSAIERSKQTTAVGDYLSHFGILLFLISAFVLFGLQRAITRTSFVRGIFFGRARRRKPAEVAPVMAALLLAGTAIVFAGSMHRWGVTLLSIVGLVAVSLAAYREMRSSRATAPVMLFVYALIALGLGLSGGVEIFTLEGDVGRMNTVFKFYLHVWMLWGVAGAFSLWYVFGVMQPQEAFLRRIGALNATIVKAPRYAFAGAAALLLVLSLVFPYFGTRARIHDRFNPAQGTSTNGLEFLAKGGIYTAHYDATGIDGAHNMTYTLDGINWIRDNIKGTPTTFEAIGPSYRSLGSRVAIYTGLPTVSGWQFHQEQQRVKFAPTVGERAADVKQFYSTTSVAQARDLIRKYDVQWVIVGDEEQFNYPATGLAKFNNGLDGALELAYQNPGMQIWHVIPQSELASAAP